MPIPNVSMFNRYAIGLIGLVSQVAFGEMPKDASGRVGPWDVDAFLRAPTAHPATHHTAPGVTAAFLEGPAFKGKPTRFFVWYGVPKAKPGTKVPGVVLVHGGGGTAFPAWVKQWNDRGYAAIALDTGGRMPTLSGVGEPVRNPDGGPLGSDNAFLQIEDALEDQWAYHAVADIMLAHSFLRALPNVDTDRIGITGISWGGYLTSIAIGVDQRFKFAVPVYGCGFLDVDSWQTRRLSEMPPAVAKRWRDHWDPANYLPRAKLPVLWINGDMDATFSLKITQLSAELIPAARRYLSIQPDMPHGHSPGWDAPEVAAFADQVVNDGRPIAQARDQGLRGSYAWARFVDVGKVKQARISFTTESGPWLGRKWKAVDAKWNDGPGEAFYTLPDDAIAFYFVLTDDRSLMVSSLPVERN